MKLYTKVYPGKKEVQWSSYDKQYALDHEKEDPVNYWEYHEILRMYRPTPKYKVLEIGCNTGEFCYLLKSTSSCYIKGIDINRDAIKIARCKYPSLSFQVADLMTLEDSGEYDIIYMQHVIEHLENPEESLLLIRNLLKRNGLLVLTCPNKWAYISKIIAWMFLTKFCYDPTHLHWFSPSSIGMLLRKTGFHIMKIKTRPLGIPAKKIPYFLQNIYYNLPAASVGAYIFVLASKLPNFGKLHQS